MKDSNSNIVKVGLSNINISFGGQTYLPYSMGLLQSYALMNLTNPETFEFSNPLYKKTSVEDGVDKLRGSEIVFFSLSLWNAELSKTIAEQIKRENPDTMVVFGGCSVPPETRVEPFLRELPYVDLACHGEGEMVFTSILENYRKNRETMDWSDTSSVSFRSNSSIKSTERAPRIKSLAEIPSPYLTGLFDKLMADNPNEAWIGLWETNRGCPYTCSYCEWGGEVGKAVTWNEIEDLEKEIDWFSEKKIEFVRCADANFGIKPKRDMRLVEKLAENKKKYGYPEAVSVENAKNSNKITFEIQKLLNDSGLSRGVNLAIQSLHSPSLEAIQRKNISNALYAELQHMFEKDGIATFTDMIIGLPEESYDTFVDGVVSLIEGGQNNSISYYNALVLPNSAMAEPEYQEKYGIQTTQIRQICNHEEIGEETIHEVEDIVIGNHALPPSDWRKVKAFAWESSLLYHRKLVQLPLTIARVAYGSGYRTLFEAFSEADGAKMPVLREVNDFFREKARLIQEEGSPNHIESDRWLRMWWPADQFMFIELIAGDRIDAFFEEALWVLKGVIGDDIPVIEEAIALNKLMLKRPFQTEDVEVNLKHNVFEVYRGNLLGEPVKLAEGNFTYRINRTDETWDSWEDWAKKVVWRMHKKGEYIYSCEQVYGTS